MEKKLHNHVRRQLFILSLVLLPFMSGSALFSQDIKVSIDAQESVSVGERFRVNYVIESDKEVNEPIVFKKIEGFDILYGPAVSTSSSVSFKEGKRIAVYSSTSSYHLMAPKAGKYTLPRAEVTIDGKKYKSETFKIEVKDKGQEQPRGQSKSRAQSQSQSTIQEPEDVDAFIRTIVSKTSVNLSDTLMITYRLYTTHNISRILRSDFPSVTGFYSSNITRSRQGFRQEKINGKTYNMVDLRKLILQPRDVGRKTIPEGQIIVEYATPTGRKVRDFWGDIYEETIKTEKTLTIESAIISVQDLKAI